MKIKQEEVQRVCRLVLEKLKEKKMITFKATEKKVHDVLTATFLKNLEEEQTIDEEARRILEENMQFTQQDLDRQKMFLMIKRKLAKDRGFVL